MNLIWTIAWRNIFRHKGKSLVIGIIMFLGATIMTVGNGIISGLNKGLQQNIVNSFTGDMVIISAKQIDKAVLFPVMGQSCEIMSNYPAIKSFLITQPYIRNFVPAAAGAAMVLSDSGEPDMYFLLGVDFAEYQKVFNNLDLVEGRFLLPGERGVLLTTFNRKMLYDYLTNYWVIPEKTRLVTANLTPEARANLARLRIRDNLVYMGFSDKNTTLDILTPVKGVVKYKAFNKFWGLFNIIDLESFRECFGYFTAADSAASVNAQAAALLNMDTPDLDSSFAGDNLLADIKQSDFSQQSLQQQTVKVTPRPNLDQGAINWVYIKLQSGSDATKALKTLNEGLKQNQLGCVAITWKDGIGQIADMALLMKGALFVFVMFIFFVAIIIIMNTLSMATLERVPEIGMMRAVGARKGFISRMFFAETAILSFYFGGMGILAGIIIVKVLSLLNLTTTNEMLQLFYGGDRFNPFLTEGDLVLCMLQLAIVTVIATLYPMSVAARITPLDAVTRD